MAKAAKDRSAPKPAADEFGGGKMRGQSLRQMNSAVRGWVGKMKGQLAGELAGLKMDVVSLGLFFHPHGEDGDVSWRDAADACCLS